MVGGQAGSAVHTARVAVLSLTVALVDGSSLTAFPYLAVPCSFATLAAAAAARAIPAPATAAPAALAAPTRAPIAAAAPAAAPAAPTAPVAAPAAPTAAPAAVPMAVPAADTAGSGLNRQRLQQLAAQASPDEYWQHAGE